MIVKEEMPNEEQQPGPLQWCSNLAKSDFEKIPRTISKESANVSIKKKSI